MEEAEIPPEPRSPPKRDSVVKIRLGKRLTGRVRLAFFEDNPDDARHAHSGACGCLWSFLDRVFTRATLYWITERGVNYGHVEIMFSNGVVVSTTGAGGVHVLEDKLLSNEGYTNFLSVRLSPGAEQAMLDRAYELRGTPFNGLARYWNNSPLKRVMVMDGQEERFYCSELVTYLLQLGARHDKNDAYDALDYRSTNPTQLYWYLMDSRLARPDWNEKESRARGKDVSATTGFIGEFLFRRKTASKTRLEKLV